MAFHFSKKTVERPAFASMPVEEAVGKVAEIYIGIDFGTTFTKVSFQVGAREGATKYSIRFSPGQSEEAYCLPSKLGYDKHTDELVFTQSPESMGVDEVKYFKYSMIEKGVPRHRDLDKRTALKNDPQRLCSAFYLAHLIRSIRQKILAHPAVKGRFESHRWYINMGVPVSDFNAKPKPIYDEALNVAWQLADGDVLSERTGLTMLDALYSKGVNHSTWSDRLNTVPELYAELIMFLQDKAVDTGFYTVVDIGGGTVDLAVFFKRIDMFSKNIDIYCVAQDVCPLGYEMYRTVLGQDEAYKRMYRSYGALIDAAYQHNHREMKKVKERHGLLTHFFMGGARNVRFYHDVVANMSQVHCNSWICYPGSCEDDMVRFMRGKGNLDVNDNPRLLISQMLAQPYEKMPELSGQPWHFNSRPIHRATPTLAELQDSLYGK